MNISVIIPVLKDSSFLEYQRAILAPLSQKIEVVLVLDPNVGDLNSETYEHEIIIKAQKRGRGHSLVAGIQYAKYDTCLFLHSDSTLSRDFTKHIELALDEPSVIGGGFSLSFDKTNPLLNLLIKLSDLLFYFFNELWGDRAMFFRKSGIQDKLRLLDIPIMEDVELSRILRQHGKMVMLKEKVITSSASFLDHNMFLQTLRILICRSWYLLGANPEKIYRFYYRKSVQL